MFIYIFIVIVVVVSMGVAKPRLRRGWVFYPTGLFIRDYLLMYKDGYPQEIWRRLKEKRDELGLITCSYNSFWCNYFRNLKALKMIEEVRREPSEHPGVKPRVYYRIKPGRENDPRWINVQDARWNIRRKLKEKRAMEEEKRK
jgi:hypothetical protein